MALLRFPSSFRKLIRRLVRETQAALQGRRTHSRRRSAGGELGHERLPKPVRCGTASTRRRSLQCCPEQAKRAAKLPSANKSNVEGSGTTALLPPRLTAPAIGPPEFGKVADPEALEPTARRLDELAIPEAFRFARTVCWNLSSTGVRRSPSMRKTVEKTSSWSGSRNSLMAVTV